MLGDRVKSELRKCNNQRSIKTKLITPALPPLSPSPPKGSTPSGSPATFLTLLTCKQMKRRATHSQGTGFVGFYCSRAILTLFT